MLKIALGIILGASVCYGADGPAASAFRDFTGGLNNDDASISIKANESPDLMNVQIDEPAGALTQRNGYLSCGNIPGGATATNLYEYAKQNGTRYLIVTDNSSIWQTADCVVYSTITTGLSATALPRFATVRDNLWIVNGSTYPIVWTGTTKTMLDGLSNRPTAPRGKLITYWKNRVWIANTPTDPSILNFTSLVDATGAELDPAVSSGAWPSTNGLYFNRGEILYGIKVYRDNLYAFSEDAISRLVFESEFTSGGIQVTKNVSKIGSKFQESIVEMDDSFLRFAGRDGVYMFDGSTVKRLSSKWFPTYQSIKQPGIAEQYKSWDSAAEWLAGSPDINISTIPNPGSISTGYEDFADLNYSRNPVWVVSTGVYTSTAGYAENLRDSGVSIIHTTNTWDNGTINIKSLTAYNGLINPIVFMSTTSALLGANLDVIGPGYWMKAEAGNVVSLRKGFTTVGVSGNICTFTSTSTFSPRTFVDVSFARNTSGNMTLSVQGHGSCSGTDTTYTSSRFFQVSTFYGGGFDDVSHVYKSTGVFTSEITTATSISAWRTFDTDQTLSGQTISYEIRTATSVYNTTIATWTAISPGAVVSTTTNGYAQWRANFSTTNNSVTPLLNSASIGWITGGSSKSALYGIRYKSRYWLAGSTTTANDYNDLTMVESKSPLYTYAPYDLPLSAMAIWNGNLYGAIGNTSKIARLDYGSTDDGAAITSYWDSRDEIFDNPILYKSINRQIADFASVPANSGIRIGLSSDFGANWSYKTMNTASNANLVRNTKVINQNANRALQFRTRIINNTLGIGFKFYGLHSFGTIGDFAGN